MPQNTPLQRNGLQSPKIDDDMNSFEMCGVLNAVSVKRRLQTADCRLQTRGKMQTEGKMQTADQG